MLPRQKISEKGRDVDSVDGKCNEGPLQTQSTIVGGLRNDVAANVETTNDQPLLLGNESAGGSPSESAINPNGDPSIHVSGSLGSSRGESNNDCCIMSSKATDSQESKNPLKMNKPEDTITDFTLKKEREKIKEQATAFCETSSQDETNKLPVNLISPDGSVLRPDLFPLIDITQHEIDIIVNQVKGGATNIKDIYALSPMQDGILFHHTMTIQGDPYLVATVTPFDNRRALDFYLVAFQKVIDRHDVFRSAFFWEHLSRPVQVVLHHAPMAITEISLDTADGPISEQLAAQFNPHESRINLTQAPLVQAVIAKESNGRWVLLQLMHHIIGDQYTLTQAMAEVRAVLRGKIETLNVPLPFRDYIAEIRSGPSDDDHKRFFTKMLADIDTPALPFGFSDVHHSGADATGSLL
ncbi:hypothetical protein BGZ79_002847, partial [Entomortierella chlamydospora]